MIFLNRSPRPPHRRGMTILEVLTVLAILGILGGTGYVIFNSVNRNTERLKLETDVRVLNNTIQSYRVAGGDLTSTSSAGQVIEQLKKVSASSAPGFKGSFVDPRLSIVMQTSGEASSDMSRAQWDQTEQRFVITSSGPAGIKRFDLDQTVDDTPPESEVRNGMFAEATSGGWLWEFEQTTATATASPDIFVVGTGTAALPDPDATGTVLLSPPVFSMTTGIYPSSQFPLTLGLNDPNPTGGGMIYYAVNGGAWQTYDPVVQILVQPDQQISAYVAASNGDYFDSIPVTHFFEQELVLAGNTVGNFTSPQGGGGMVASIGSTDGGTSDNFFEFGGDTTGAGGSTLEFEGEAFTGAELNDLFKLGSLSYFNSETAMGTEATQVQLELDLNLDFAAASNDPVNITFDLESTENLSYLDASQQADFVRFSNIQSNYSINLDGEDYFLYLQFGYTGSNGFASIDQFHVNEGASAAADIFGYFSTEAMVPEDTNLIINSGGGVLPPSPFP